MRRVLTVLLLVVPVVVVVVLAVAARPGARPQAPRARGIVGPPPVLRRPAVDTPAPADRDVYLSRETVMPPEPTALAVAPPPAGPDPATFTPAKASADADGDRPPRKVPGLP